MAPTGGFDAAVVIAVGEGEVVAEAVLVVLVVAEELCEVLTISESYLQDDHQSNLPWEN